MDERPLEAWMTAVPGQGTASGTLTMTACAAGSRRGDFENQTRTALRIMLHAIDEAGGGRLRLVELTARVVSPGTERRRMLDRVLREALPGGLVPYRVVRSPEFFGDAGQLIALEGTAAEEMRAVA